MVIGPTYQHLLAPFVVAVAMVVIVLICRWVFATPDRVSGRGTPSQPDDFGLLVPVATVATADDAKALAAVVREAGLRVTVTRVDGGHAVLVWPDDAPRAEQLLPH